MHLRYLQANEQSFGSFNSTRAAMVHSQPHSITSLRSHIEKRNPSPRELTTSFRMRYNLGDLATLLAASLHYGQHTDVTPESWPRHPQSFLQGLLKRKELG